MAACALFAGGVTASAYTVDDLTTAGWSQVSSLTDVENYYYVFVDAGQQATAMFRNNESDARPTYNTLADPMENLEEVWVIAQNGDNYNIKGNSESFFFNSGDAGWNDYVGHNNDNGNFTFTLNGGKYDIKSVTVTTNNFVGPWNNDGAVSASLPENIACNKSDAQAPGFYLYSILRTTFEAQLAEARTETVSSASEESPADVTSYIVNPSFTSKNAQGWTRSGSYGNQQWGQSTMESWNATNVVVQQELRGIPNGKYRVTADIISGPGATKAAFVFAIGTSKISSSVVSVEASANNYTTMSNEVAGNTLTADNVVVTNNAITIGFDQSTGWIVADNFKLYYLGEDLSIYQDAYSEAVDAANAVDQDAPMLGTALTALQTALSNYGTGVDTSDKDALLTATSALGTATTNATTSIAAYAKAKTAIDAAEDLQTNNNFVTSAAATTFAEAIANIKTPYNNATLANDAATNAATTLGVVAVGWHAAATNTPASNYMGSAWPSTYTINDWSVEGESDGSDYVVPFFQDWIADANSLATKTLTGTVSSLDNGLYSVSAWVRVRAKDETAATDATGITMDVNGGGEGDYAAVDVTEGTQVGSTQFQMATYTAQGLVKDGNLTLNFNVLDGNNVSWLSFKNIKYTKVRDLTAEEAAVTPADLAIDATKTIYIGKTATLTPTSTTDDASIDGYVTWTSSDESVATVANGVVTAVAYGTANITVTSTLNTEATATCEVTVTAPLITEAENLDFSDGPVVTDGITIRTYAKDKTGSDVSGMQEVSGWTIVSNGDAKASGVVAYGSNIGLGAPNSCYAPATNPDGNAGNVLGMVGVWTGSVQYTQNVKLLAGVYTIEVPVYMTKVTNTEALTKNLIGVILDDGTEHLATTTTYTNGSWKTETIQFNISEETYGKLSLGLTNPNTGSANSQRLYIDGVTVTYEPFATSDDYADLNSAIEAKGGKTLGFQAGEYAPYNNVAVLEALAAANAIDKTANNAQSTVQAATAALTAAAWGEANTEEVNAIYDGSFTIQTVPATNTKPLGWSRHSATANASDGTDSGYETRLVTLVDGVTDSNVGMMTKFHAFYGDQTGYTMPLKANTYYALTFKYAGWNNTPTMHINVYSEDGTRLAQSDNFDSQNGETDASKWTEYKYVFQTADAGNYVIGLIKNSGATTQNQAGFTEFNLIQVPETSVNMAVTDAKYATFIAPFEVTIPDGVTAYTVTAPTEGNTLTLTEVETSITANTPVVLYSESVVNENKAGYSIATKDSYTTGLLTGTYTQIAAPNESYILQNQDGKVGFYQVNTAEAQPNVPANRAYLTAPANARPAAFFFDSEATGINAINALTTGEAEIYDVNGMKLQKLQKGMNIIRSNGKTYKVVVK